MHGDPGVRILDPLWNPCLCKDDINVIVTCFMLSLKLNSFKVSNNTTRSIILLTQGVSFLCKILMMFNFNKNTLVSVIFILYKLFS